MSNEERYYHLEERVFFLPLARKIARFLLRTKITPNLISLFHFLFTFFSCLVIYFLYLYKNPFFFLVSAALFYLIFLFDKIDGELARFKKLSSEKGAHLDSFFDRLEEIFILLFLAFVTKFFDNLLLISSLIGILFFYLNLFMAQFYYFQKLKENGFSFFPQQNLRLRDFKNIFAFSRSKFFLLLIILSLLGRPEFIFYLLPFLIPYSILFFLIVWFKEK